MGGREVRSSGLGAMWKKVHGVEFYAEEDAGGKKLKGEGV